MLFYILIGLKLQVNNTDIYIISQCYLKPVTIQKHHKN